MVRASKTYAEPWERFDRLVTAVAGHLRDTGQTPELVNGVGVAARPRVHRRT
jgi:hypothetical protein